MKFRRLLKKPKLGEALFAKLGEVLQGRRLKVGTGTVVDATIIGASSPTKNADKKRHPEMHQTRKGQQWFFGMKLHIGVHSKTGLAHSAVVTAAIVHDKHPLLDLLHGDERAVYGDSAYASQRTLIKGKAPNARDATNRRVRESSLTADRERPIKPSQIPCSIPCRTCVRRRQAFVQLQQGAVSGPCEERKNATRE